MPTKPHERSKRYLVAGHFREDFGYAVQRPQGCHDYLLLYTVAGAGQIGGEQSALTTGHGDAVLIAPDVAHHYRVAERDGHWELLWAHFRPPSRWKSLLTWPSQERGIGHLKLEQEQIRQQVQNSLQHVCQLAAGYLLHREALSLNALEAALTWCDEWKRRQGRQTLDHRIQEVLNRICHRLDAPLSIAELAEVCHLSPSRFAHLFREQMEITPQQFVEQQRIERAKELLEHSGLTVAEIARAIGFRDGFYFSRRFKHATGKSPRQYRQETLSS